MNLIQMTIITTTVGKNPIGEMEVPSNSLYALLGCNLQNNRMKSGSFQGKPFNGTVIQIHAPTTDAEETEADESYQPEDLELTPKADIILFMSGDWYAKVGGQEIPGVPVKFGLGEQNETGQRLTEFCQENALIIANTHSKQHKKRAYIQTSPSGQY